MWSDTETASVAIYKCDNGYHLEGRNQRVCKVTGEWSDSEPQCRGISSTVWVYYIMITSKWV